MIFVYIDFNNFFDVFCDGSFLCIEYNVVQDVMMGDEFIVYMNLQCDFKIYNGDVMELIINQIV